MTTSEDPNVQQTETGETVVLEPGDPGYVAPDGAQPPDQSQPDEPRPEDAPTVSDGPTEHDAQFSGSTLGGNMAPDIPPQPHEEGGILTAEPMPPGTAGRDLRFQNQPGEDPSAVLLRTRGMVVESTRPTDIVPNTPQIRPFPAEGESNIDIVETEGEVAEGTGEPETFAEQQTDP